MKDVSYLEERNLEYTVYSRWCNSKDLLDPWMIKNAELYTDGTNETGHNEWVH